MTYQEAEQYISDIPKFTKKNSTNHTDRFLEALGSPQQNKKIIHVAGTNGKGSVCVYMEHLLQSEGKAVGTFISPHLIVMNERMRINGTMVSDDEFIQLFEETMSAVEELKKEGLSHPTFFEFLFGMAMKAFARAEVEYVILETGLGGRLDATNCIKQPILTMITQIGMDHMQYLGDTVTAIAGEKAGIIKSQVPCFYMENEECVNQVIEKRADQMHAPCRKIPKSAYEICEINHNYIAFSCTNAYYEDTTWRLSNIGIYQAANAMMALEAMRYLFPEEKHLEQWQKALSETVWEGRMEEVAPDVYVDGAHNISAIEGFVGSTADRTKDYVILFSAVEDKDYEEMIAYLCEHMDAQEYIVTTVEDSRAASCMKLGQVFKEHTLKPVTVIERIEDAVHYALERQNGRTIYCLGSLYLAGTIKDLAELHGNS